MTFQFCDFRTGTATDIPTHRPVTLNLQDPASMIFNPLGDLILDSPADAELIIVHHPVIPTRVSTISDSNKVVFHQ